MWPPRQQNSWRYNEVAQYNLVSVHVGPTGYKVRFHHNILYYVEIIQCS